jgi:hypothetical protein
MKKETTFPQFPTFMPFVNRLEFDHKVLFMPFNRDGRVRIDLVNSMNDSGFTEAITMIRTALIDGVDRIYLIDGHNRVATASYLKIPFYGILLNNQFENVEQIVAFVAKRNNTHKAWDNWDYIRAFNYVGRVEYQKLIEVKSKSPFSVTTIASLLHGTRRGAIASIIRSGKFKVARPEETKRVLSFSAYLSKYKHMSNRMLISLDNVMGLDIFDAKKFETAYAKYCKSINSLNLDTFDDTFISWLK